MQLIDLFDRGVTYGPQADCLAEPGGRALSYGQVQDLSHRVANGLVAAGVGRGDKIGLLSDNHLFTFVAILGTVRSPGIWLPVNARNAPDENANILSRGGCSFLFVHSRFAGQLDLLRAAMPGLKGVVCIDGELPGVPSLERWASRQSPAPARSDARPDDVVAIRGTGGTTGLPKGVLITHRNYAMLFANWYAAMPVQERPVHLVVAPMTHAAGTLMFAACGYGGSNLILPTAEPGTVLQTMRRHHVTQLFLPPTAIYKLLTHPEARGGGFGSLRHFVYAAAPMSADKLREALEVFGPVMVQLYGQAEAPMVCAVLDVDDHKRILADPSLSHRLASCGRPSPLVRMGIMDPHGQLLDAGQRGEIVVQGDLVMKGYYEDPGKTDEAMRHGWLHTGDVGYRDEDGFFYIVDRVKDLIVSGGFNITPSEIERVLWAHPAVNDCAVVGVPDPLWGESVKAIVELKPGASWDEQQGLAWCRDRLGAMKSPKSIEVWDVLPRSPVGKVLKRDIRERFWQDQARRV